MNIFTKILLFLLILLEATSALRLAQISLRLIQVNSLALAKNRTSSMPNTQLGTFKATLELSKNNTEISASLVQPLYSTIVHLENQSVSMDSYWLIEDLSKIEFRVELFNSMSQRICESMPVEEINAFWKLVCQPPFNATTWELGSCFYYFFKIACNVSNEEDPVTRNFGAGSAQNFRAVPMTERLKSRDSTALNRALYSMENGYNRFYGKRTIFANALFGALATIAFAICICFLGRLIMVCCCRKKPMVCITSIPARISNKGYEQLKEPMTV